VRKEKRNNDRCRYRREEVRAKKQRQPCSIASTTNKVVVTIRSQKGKIKGEEGGGKREMNPYKPAPGIEPRLKPSSAKRVKKKDEEKQGVRKV